MDKIINIFFSFCDIIICYWKENEKGHSSTFITLKAKGSICVYAEVD